MTGDWFYYTYIQGRDIPNIDSDILEPVFLGVCIASTVFSLLSLLVMGCGCNLLVGCNRVCGIKATNWVSLLEIALEDIPQLVITVMVSYQIRGPLSSQAVFNLTTSSMNFALDILDIADDFADDREDLEKEGGVSGRGDGEASSPYSQVY